MRRVFANPLAAIAFLAPAAVIYFVFSLFAIAESFGLSFFRFNLGTLTWRGLSNYLHLLRDTLFFAATWHIIELLLVVAIIAIPVSFFVGLSLTRGRSASDLVKSIMYIPNLLSTVATGTMWVYLFDNQFGIVNRILHLFGVAIQTSLLSSERFVVPVIGFVMAWQSVGFYSILFFIAIGNVPADITDSCRLDGFSEWQRIRYVILPLIFPTIQIVVVLVVTGAFKSFDYVYVLSGGGPNHASEVLSSYLYTVGFQYGDMGYAATLGVVLFLMSLIISRAIYRLGRQQATEY